MKQKDWALILVVVFVSGVLSFFLSNALFNSSDKKQEQVEVVGAITTDFQTPDSRYFNKDSVNPTRLIKIGDSSNDSPFNNNQQ